ncbi:hypothetical protein ALC62_09611 [Cyphomyrmex costatus]|uniref:DDE-1 domain-containing protein n=1 Tax=Cyphomyrmex costatus TaxID=456900 RepID=A0A151IFB8_9HYME|nr:hypothetical protein ALC62_09611 [Cyphomyrmex costatus]
MRNYKRKTNRASVPEDIVMRAVKDVVDDGQSYKSISSAYEIPIRSLIRYCNKYRIMNIHEASILTQNKSLNVGYKNCSKFVFNNVEEVKLEKYLMKCNDIYFGLSPKEVRKLAYQYAVAIEAKFPESWTKNMMAGPDWFTKFMKRHTKLSIRSPEATSLARTTSFNRTNVEFLFFNNLIKVMTRFKFQPCDVWNMDETGVFTVQKPNKIVARRGIKQIGRLSSAERGQLVTVACTVSATGNSVPPFFVFPRGHFKDHFIRDGSVGCAGGANPSGWINETNFLIYLTHFVKNVKPSRTNRVLLLLDNHDSHLSINALNFAKENGIIILSFPPHYSHKMQLLDVSVYGPLKKFLSTAQDSWMLSHPGKTLTICFMRRYLYIKINTVFNGEFIAGDKRANKSIATRNFEIYRCTDQREWSKHVNLLYVEDDIAGHFVLIKDLSRLVSSQISKKKNRKYFCDSDRFLASSLDKLASFLSKDKLRVLRREFSHLSDENFNLLTRKGVFPYEYIDCSEKLNESCLSPRESFYSSLTDVHRILQFTQSPWLRDYIELNTKFRTLAKNDFEKNLYKLINNAVFDKTMENVRDRVDVKLLTKWEGKYGAEAMIAKPNFHSRSVFSENLVAIELRKLEVKFDKPMWVCASSIYRKRVCTSFITNIWHRCFTINVKLCIPILIASYTM